MMWELVMVAYRIMALCVCAMAAHSCRGEHNGVSRHS